MDYIIRKATLADRDAINELIKDSARGLSRSHYSQQQIEAAVASVFGVDTDLILDRTYFIAESNGQIIGCGGWSRRRNIFGGDRYAHRDSATVDPKAEPAKIRAFFVHSSFARQGVGKAILSTCEADALAAGFYALELMSTLPGVEFYKACGYEGKDRLEYDVNGVKIEFLPMRKQLSHGHDS
jgi:N-acetylglutamate synthase-like GNAT family acetyltransferase